MDVLREAFVEHHALQCGFCTPGMLMMARDIVTRLPDADETESARIVRKPMPLHRLCWHRGAVQSALEKASKRRELPHQIDRGRTIGPVGSHPPTTPQDFSRPPATAGR